MKTEPIRSLAGRIWKERSEWGEGHRQLALALSLPAFLAPLFGSRDLANAGDAERFLTPRLRDLADPLGLVGMACAVARLARAVEAGEGVGIFGDYDVDGLTSSALLSRYFQALGIPFRVVIPNRLADGYGPNLPGLLSLREAGFPLVVTVDCGVTAFEPLAGAKAAGMEVIVTDHHQCGEVLPEAVTVIDPNQPGDSFPHKELAGVGVAFYLLAALNRALRERGFFRERPEPDLKQWLDLVAVGTIADVASLTGMNRLLTAHALAWPQGPRNPGLRALMAVAGVKSFGVGAVGFQIGPRLNAGGRLGMDGAGYELLMSEDGETCARLARFLDAANRERQTLEEEMTEAAVARILADPEGGGRLGLVAAGRGWHAGVVGIVASRLVARFHKPAVVVALDEQGLGKGSGRSIVGVDLLAALQGAGEHLLGFGGHRAAAGLTVREEALPAFARAFHQALVLQDDGDRFLPTLWLDGAVPLEEIRSAWVRRLTAFGPFGRGNPEPLFRVRGRVVRGRLLKERHVKCVLEGERGGQVECIAFGAWPGLLGEALLGRRGSLLEVAGHLSLSTWQGEERVQLQVEDARPVG